MASRTWNERGAGRSHATKHRYPRSKPPCSVKHLQHVGVAMHFDEAVQYLLSLGNEVLTMKLGLRNTELLFTALKHPECSFPSVQIAGTNGKGSVAAMLDSICQYAGIKVGCYTSPHL